MIWERRPECRQGAEPAVARAGDKQFTVVQKKVKPSHTRTERWTRSWSRCSGSQPAGDRKSSTRR